MNNFPRRNKIYEQTPAEKAIRNAMAEVEKAGLDPRLTEVGNTLGKAFEMLADIVDDALLKNEKKSD
jgi:predicted hydrocarbon binding protein